MTATRVYQCLPETQWIALGQAIQDMSLRWSDVSPFGCNSAAQISIGRDCKVEAAGRVFEEGVYLLDDE